MKRYIRNLSPLFLIFSIYLQSEQLQFNTQAEAAILINGKSGAILFEKNSYKPMYPASVTKIAIALYVLKVLGENLDEVVSVPQDAVVSITEAAKAKANFSQPSHWLEPDGTHVSLKRGDAFSIRDLMYGMMLASGNDAANTIAFHLEKSMPTFMKQINSYLEEIGCQNTFYCNPHGLFHPDHHTTAYDLALMAQEGLKNPLFRKIVGTVRYTMNNPKQNATRALIQGNKLLRAGKLHYPKAIGVKTGYIRKAGHNLVAAAEDDGRLLIAVLLKASDRGELFNDAINLFEQAFNEKKTERLLFKKGIQKFTYQKEGAAVPIKAYLDKDLFLSYFPAETPQVKCLVAWDSPPLPIIKNQKLGELLVQNKEGFTLMTAPLFAVEDVKAQWTHSLKTVKSLLLNNSLLHLLAAATFVALILFYALRKRKR